MTTTGPLCSGLWVWRRAWQMFLLVSKEKRGKSLREFKECYVRKVRCGGGIW